VALAGLMVMELRVAGPPGATGVVLELGFLPPPQLASSSEAASTATNNNRCIVFTSGIKRRGNYSAGTAFP
jgi:hypothetical protein